MFSNIGRKIKGLAKFFFIVTAIIDIIVGLVLIAIDDDFVAIGLPIMLVGPVLAWISSWLLYGFGQLIDNSDKLVERFCFTNDTPIQSQTGQNKTRDKEVPTSTEKGTCELCRKTDVYVRDAKIVDNMGTRYRRICDDCYEKNNASPAK